MCFYRLIAAAAACIALQGGGPALADSVTWHMPGEEAYRSLADSPFAGIAGDEGQIWLEDFEDGLLNSPGLASVAGGTIREPGPGTDSVDGDGDSQIDGWGTGGSSFFEYNPEGACMEFVFDADALGGLPTFAALVWTDGNAESPVTFEAFDALGASLGSFQATLGDGIHNSSTDADRLLGVEFAGGISAIRISAEFGSLEIDHVQYGFAVMVPLPAPLGMGLAGLGIVAIIRRRRSRDARQFLELS